MDEQPRVGPDDQSAIGPDRCVMARCKAKYKRNASDGGSARIQGAGPRRVRVGFDAAMGPEGAIPHTPT